MSSMRQRLQQSIVFVERSRLVANPFASLSSFRNSAPPPPPAPAAPRAPTMFTPAAPLATGQPPQMMQPPAQFSHQPPPPPGQQFSQPQPAPPGPIFGQQQPPPPGQPGHGQLNTQGASSPFYGQPPSASQMQRAPAPPGAQATATNMPAPFQENVDFSIQIPERLCRFTVKKIPQIANMASSSKVPIGAILRPLAPCSEDEEDVDTVQPGNSGIIRCKK